MWKHGRFRVRAMPRLRTRAVGVTQDDDIIVACKQNLFFLRADGRVLASHSFPEATECVLSPRGVALPLKRTTTRVKCGEMGHIPASTYFTRITPGGDFLSIGTDNIFRVNGSAIGPELVCTSLCADGSPGQAVYVYGGIDGRLYDSMGNSMGRADPPSPVTAVAAVRERIFVTGHLDGSLCVWRRGGAEGTAARCVARHANRHRSPIRHLHADMNRVVSVTENGHVVASSLVAPSTVWFHHRNQHVALEVSSVACGTSVMALGCGSDGLIVLDFSGLKSGQ